MKPFYSIKGKFPDGRNKVVIVLKKRYRKITKTLPKPEKMWEILGYPKNDQKTNEKEDTSEVST